MNANAKRHFENLDALRFFAFLLVFLSHGFFRLPLLQGTEQVSTLASFAHLGRLGVDFFFVLSSFLITWIILEERQATGQFKAGYFLIRRSLRIWPLYFIIVLLGYTVIFLQHQFLNTQSTHENPSPGWFLFFIINLYIVHHGDAFLFFLVFLWSVAIEEQFYLFWAAVMRWLPKLLTPVCLSIIFISLLYRFFHLDQSTGLYFHTLSALGNFGVGALTAIFCFRQGPIFHLMQHPPKLFTALIYLLLLTCIIFYERIFNAPVLVVGERLLFSLLFAFVIFDQCLGHRSLFKAGSSAVVNHLGKISYGLYCYHGVVITFTVQALHHFRIRYESGWVMMGMAFLIFMLTVALAHVSYRFFEGRFLDMRRKYY